MMTRFSSLLLAVVLVAGILAVTAACADSEFVLFSGELDKVEAAPWGNGVIDTTDEEQYIERDVLEIQTNGFFEGGRLDLKTPKSMKQFFEEPEKSFLVLIVKVHQGEAVQQGAGTGGATGPVGPMDPMMDPMMDPAMMAPGAPPEMMAPPPMPGGGAPGAPGVPPEMMDPMMDPAMMGPGGPMDPGMMPPGPGDEGLFMGGQQQAEPEMVTKLRAVLITDKGQFDSGAINIDQAEDAVENWRTLVIPIKQFAGLGGDPASSLQKIAFFGNADEKFWLATVKLVQESQPLVADAGAQRIVKVNREVEFTAKEQAGDARVQYVWDFDDWDGVGEDGLGQTSKWKFEEPGFYTVTLTVKDRTGRHLPQTARVDVKVEE